MGVEWALHTDMDDEGMASWHLGDLHRFKVHYPNNDADAGGSFDFLRSLIVVPKKVLTNEGKSKDDWGLGTLAEADVGDDQDMTNWDELEEGVDYYAVIDVQDLPCSAPRGTEIWKLTDEDQSAILASNTQKIAEMLSGM